MCRHANEGKSTDWLNSINSSLKPKQTVFTHSVAVNFSDFMLRSRPKYLTFHYFLVPFFDSNLIPIGFVFKLHFFHYSLNITLTLARLYIITNFAPEIPTIQWIVQFSVTLMVLPMSYVNAPAWLRFTRLGLLTGGACRVIFAPITP